MDLCQLKVFPLYSFDYENIGSSEEKVCVVSAESHLNHSVSALGVRVSVSVGQLCLSAFVGREIMPY